LIVVSILCVSVGGLFLLGNFADSSDTEPKQPEQPKEEIVTSTYWKISAEEAWEIINSDDPHIILDVRTREEFQESHIPNAILIPDYEIATRVRAEIPDKSTIILIYCRSGNRSAKVARELIAMGYKNVFDFGGIIDWPYLLTIANQDESYEVF